MHNPAMPPREAPEPSAPIPTAFVLAGGGSLGAVQVGMLQALLAWGEVPSLLVGTSAGAINAAYIASDPTFDCADGLGHIWCAVRRQDVLPLSVRSIVAGMFGRRGNLVDSRGLRSFLERNLPYRVLEQAAVPVHLVASEVATGQEVVLSTGPAVEAVLASSAIPGVFPPVKLGSQWLMDGGVANNAPISVAVGLGAKRIIVLPTGFACALPDVPRGAIASAMHAVSMLVARQLVRDAEHWINSHIVLRIVPALCPLAVSPYDYSAARPLIERARASTQQWLEGGGLERATIPTQIQEHRH